MSEGHHEAGEPHKAEEVVDVVFPSCEPSTIVLHSGKESFDFPAAAIATQRTPILGLLLAVGSIRAKPLFSPICLHVEVKACEIREWLLRGIVGARLKQRSWCGILNKAV
jgi:hypothetical protein